MRYLALVALASATTAAFGQFVIMPDSTNNRIVLFDPTNGSLLNSNFFGLAGGTPIHAMQVGNEIWVSEQVGDRVSRWSLSGTALGAITGGMDNIRGMGRVGNNVYVTNSGSANGAPGNAVLTFDLSGNSTGSFLTPNAPSPFGILPRQGGMLVSSANGNDDIHIYSLAGTSLGTFHNSTNLNFAEQMAYSLSGNVLVAGFSSNNVLTLDPGTGAVLGSFTAGGARGVYQLGNGNILWSNSSGVHLFDVASQTSQQVYQGGGRYLEFAPVPEPATIAVLGAGLALLVRRRRP